MHVADRAVAGATAEVAARLVAGAEGDGAACDPTDIRGRAVDAVVVCVDVSVR